MSLDMLFSPIRINALELPNRIVMPPMGTNFADGKGRVTEQLIAYYARRARGGPGLIIVEHTAVHPTGRTGRRMLCAFSEGDHFDGLQKLFAAVHDAGGRVGIQLNHGGRQASAEAIGEQVWAPSAVVCPDGKSLSREMTHEDVAEVREAFVSAAGRAKRAGADAVEVHMAHGYLLCEFLSSYTNKRTDEYGGDLDGRCRLPTEVVRGVRERVGPDFPILVRISADELIDGGLTTEVSQQNAQRLVEAGADALDVSVCLGETAHMASAPYYVEQGHLVPYAEAIKQAVDVPVIGVGRITEPEYANRIIAERRVDLVAVGRGMIADPDWAAKALADRPADIIPCIACNLGCSDRRNSALGQVHCLTNPFTGFETERRMEPATSRKRVLVVGGGPGGMQAAVIAARRGHEVTLTEREPELGGAYRLAHRAPGKALLKTFLDYLVRQLGASGAHVRLNEEASADSILRDPPDVVVVATGGRFAPPAIPAIDAVRVVAALDLLRETAVVEGVVAVVGGDYLGLETADLLAGKGCRVTVFGRNPVVGPTFVAGVRKLLLDRLSRAGVTIHAGAEVVELRPGSVVVAGETEATEFSGFDAVVMATGLRGDGHIAAQLLRKVDEIHIIGDAVQPRTALNAVHEGAEVALRL